MFKVTRWIALSGPNGEATVHYDRQDARRAAEAARKRLGEVKVYEVTGWPVQDLWDRPRRLDTAPHHLSRIRARGVDHL